MIRHNNEGVQLVPFFRPIVLQRFKEQFGHAGNLKQAPAIVGDACDEEGSSSGSSLRGAHDAKYRSREQWLLRLKDSPSAEW